MCPGVGLDRNAGEHSQPMVLLAPNFWTEWLTAHSILATHFGSAQVFTGDIIKLRVNETALDAVQRSTGGVGPATALSFFTKF